MIQRCIPLGRRVESPRTCRRRNGAADDLPRPLLADRSANRHRRAAPRVPPPADGPRPLAQPQRHLAVRDRPRRLRARARPASSGRSSARSSCRSRPSRELSGIGTPTSSRPSGTAARSPSPPSGPGDAARPAALRRRRPRHHRVGRRRRGRRGTAAGSPRSPPTCGGIARPRARRSRVVVRARDTAHGPQARGKQAPRTRTPTATTPAPPASGRPSGWSRSRRRTCAARGSPRPGQRARSTSSCRCPANRRATGSRVALTRRRRRGRTGRRPAPISTSRPRCALAVPDGPRARRGRPAIRTCTASTSSCVDADGRRRRRRALLRRPARRSSIDGQGGPDQRRAGLPAARARPGLLARRRS